jgi:hypothetical protein
MLVDNNGNPEVGAVQPSAQGQFVDTNGNGILDSLQASGPLLEDHDVLPSRSMTLHSGAALEEWCGLRPARILPMPQLALSISGRFRLRRLYVFALLIQV